MRKMSQKVRSDEMMTLTSPVIITPSPENGKKLGKKLAAALKAMVAMAATSNAT